ncbi:AMP-binding protein [Serpentinicella alkaliphila]|uniref:Long-chain acyl-CoA synthetase n=1 Tax=Serpentinicella alkaliphila TaxID=1734049 RepID=A0A4R2TNY1_9FIRM|nr:AMP-binding protein [Serpentinicella alkaliphila]QUH27120.1 AMP-binding protein [Serpentinicella alkaliphila]TCQ05251.1 long-chain acyl-CoA synthetase [Serpentinicella alkaliphila]
MCLSIIDRIATNDGKREFIQSDYEEYSYLEAKEFIDNISEQLLKFGNKGDLVIIKEDSPVKQLMYFLSSWKAGLISVILSPNISKENYKRLINKIDPRIIINGEIKLYKDNRASGLDHGSNLFLCALSSGTTGEEKLIWRSYNTWERAFKHQSEIFNINKGNRLLLNGNFHYTANLNGAIHIFYEGGTLVHTKKQKPMEIMNIINKKNIDAIFMVPALYKILTTSDNIQSLEVKSVVSAGSKLDMNTFSRLKEIFPKAKIVEYYGASELGHISYLNFEDSLQKEGSVGRAFPDVQIIIENEKVWVKSPYIADGFPTKHSAGDLGYLDEDNFLFLTGREGNIINKAGEKIMAEEIEKVIMQHPDVNEAVVIGKAHHLKGEEIMAVISIYEKLNEVELKNEIKMFCKRYLEYTKVPKDIVIINSIPRNENGKIDRRLLKQFGNGSLI